MAQEKIPNGAPDGDDKKPKEPKDLIKIGNGDKPSDKLEKPNATAPPGISSISRLAKDAADSAKIAAKKREEKEIIPERSEPHDFSINPSSVKRLEHWGLSSEKIKRHEQERKFEAQKIPPLTFPDIDLSQLPWFSEKEEIDANYEKKSGFCESQAIGKGVIDSR